MRECEISEIGNILDVAPKSMNLFFVGDTGIGKTTAIERWCADHNVYLKTLILSQLEASETLGIPVRSSREWNGVEYDCLKTAIPNWVFDLAEHKNSMLFLDEFLCAQPSVMNAFLNFLTQKRVVDIDLSHVRIVAASNIGNYTFEPDNNVLSRFCWFYAVNTQANEWLNDKRIINRYKDENEREGVVFERRSLKPRCQEQLMDVPDEWLPIFYEGYTNSRYVMVHKNGEINDVITPYFVSDGPRTFTISDENIVTMVAVLVKAFPRFRKWDNVISGFFNMDTRTIAKIKKEILRVVDKG